MARDTSSDAVPSVSTKTYSWLFRSVSITRTMRSSSTSLLLITLIGDLDLPVRQSVMGWLRSVSKTATVWPALASIVAKTKHDVLLLDPPFGFAETIVGMRPSVLRRHGEVRCRIMQEEAP